MQVNEHPVEQEEVMAYLDGELPQEQAAIVAAHLTECAECQGLAAKLGDVSRQLANWRVEPSKVRLPRKPRRRALWTWVGAFAAACLLIGLAVQPIRMHNFDRAMPAPPSAPAAKPMIARTSQLALITKQFDQGRAALEDILKRHRGYLGQLDVAAPPGGPRVLTATLRVPADQLDPAMAEIKKLGQVESESLSGEEVTEQYVDLEARLTNARSTEQRLTALLRDRTAQITDVLAVEKEIDRVRGEIEQMEAQKKTLVNRVDFATLNVALREASQAEISPHSTLDRFRNAAAEGYASLLAGVVGAAVFLLSHGPNLLFWGALSFLVLRFAWKKWRRVKFGR
jgi:Domain of unknown function (DUF4349)/Putative zinc-finger